MRKRVRSAVRGGAIGLALTACDAPIRLAEAPSLYRMGMGFPMSEVPPAQRSVAPQILYITDRAPEMRDGEVVRYGFERSASMVVGSAQVRFGDFASWADLVARSESGTGDVQLLETGGYRELVRFPETPLPAMSVAGRAAVVPEAARAYEDDVSAFKSVVAEQLRRSPRKDVILFIHGFNAELEDGLTTTASLWHYSARVGVPISYSWPAGNKGLTAYFKDRESGEFSIFHLKETLRALAAIPGLERIHIVAHSRGTDVATSAIRELAIFEKGAGRDARRSLKIETLILAAPDLDFGVVQQRLAAEGTAAAVGQVNIYLNPNDGALGLAQSLATGTRIGRLSPEDLTEEDWADLDDVANVQFINVEAAGGRIGHVYFRENPAVLSDIVLTLRTGAAPGSALRPLDPVRGNFWSLHANYPGPRIVPEYRTNSDR